MKFEEEISQVIDDLINPALSAHGGFIELEYIDGYDVYIRMGGGCQGCAASKYTLKSGIETLLREEVDGINSIIDVTDHEAGLSPYYFKFEEE